MKVVVSDYPNVLKRKNLQREIDILKDRLGENAEVVVYYYKSKEVFLDLVSDADAILTAFLNINREVFERAGKLKIVALNATGYDFVDVQEATKRNVAVCPIGEYCTWEVAEHTIALMMALSRGLKFFNNEIDNKNNWRYTNYIKELGELYRMEGQTWGVFGLGKIGKAVARKAMGLGMNVVAVDPYIKIETAAQLGVRMVDPEYVWENADIISNHMNRNEANEGYFSMIEFEKMKKQPIFINTGRGACVVEKDLIKSLDLGLLRGVGVDVLEEENPDLKNNRLTNRLNVIITPHVAFYSEHSYADLQRIPCENIAYYLKGEKEKVFKIVNKV